MSFSSGLRWDDFVLQCFVISHAENINGRLIFRLIYKPARPYTNKDFFCKYPGLYGPQKGQVGWQGYLSPKSGSPASILGSPAIYSKKAKRFFFPLFMLVMVLMLFSSIFKVACLRNAIFFFFSLPFCWILVGNFPRIQVVQRDYLNPTLGSPTGLFLEFRSSGRWDYAIC